MVAVASYTKISMGRGNHIGHAHPLEMEKLLGS